MSAPWSLVFDESVPESESVVEEELVEAPASVVLEPEVTEWDQLSDEEVPLENESVLPFAPETVVPP